MTIGAAARAAGVGVETVRFYERRGLIAQPPRPAGGGYRAYPPDTVRRLRFIRRAQAIGFSLREIGDLLGLERDGVADCGDVRSRARARLDQVEATIADLAAMGAALRALIAACPGAGELDACSIINALAEPEPARGAQEPPKNQTPGRGRGLARS